MATLDAHGKTIQKPQIKRWKASYQPYQKKTDVQNKYIVMGRKT